MIKWVPLAPKETPLGILMLEIFLLFSCSLLIDIDLLYTISKQELSEVAVQFFFIKHNWILENSWCWVIILNLYSKTWACGELWRQLLQSSAKHSRNYIIELIVCTALQSWWKQDVELEAWNCKNILIWPNKCKLASPHSQTWLPLQAWVWDAMLFRYLNQQ